MDNATLTYRWWMEFLHSLDAPKSWMPLKEAAWSGVLGDWTRHLTPAVVATCEEKGWRAVARGSLGEVFPVPCNEDMAIDVIAFPYPPARWSLPAGIFELVSSNDDDRVAYSLWKVLCVRAALRIVFAYRRDVEEGDALVTYLTETLIGELPLSERLTIFGEISLIIGNRGGADTFPNGYFRAWMLDTNTGRFDSA